MNVKKLFVSTAAAVSVVGLIGIAYAQTADTGAVVPAPAASQSVPTTEAMPGHPAMQMQGGSAGTTSGTTSGTTAPMQTQSGSSGTTPDAAAPMSGAAAPMSGTGAGTTSDATTPSTERAPQTDRN